MNKSLISKIIFLFLLEHTAKCGLMIFNLIFNWIYFSCSYLLY